MPLQIGFTKNANTTDKIPDSHTRRLANNAQFAWNNKIDMR